jgi:murein DD-endopeptidase MepM/ murein hydrolase activator NlpD
MDGKVVYAGWNNQGYGNLVIVQNGQYRTYFAHLSKFKVKAGDTIQAGSEVALSGNTGNSTGPHLHYEVRRNGTQLNPSKFL